MGFACSVSVPTATGRSGAAAAATAVAVATATTTNSRSAHAVALKKDHNVLHPPLFLPGFHDASGAHLADPVYLEDAQRLLTENLQGVQSKCRHQTFRVTGADPLDQPRAEIFFNAVETGRIDLVPVIDVKL